MNLHKYETDPEYTTRVAYFSMEYAVHQALKTYAGGLGFLAGSHMRSAFELRQNVIGIGILWSFGYYDQSRYDDRSLKIEFIRKHYHFLEDMNIQFPVKINSSDVHVKVYLLKESVFGCAPVIFLTTDIPENNFLARTITHYLYESNEQTRIAQEIVLGIGGIKALEALGLEIDIYHMSEVHALPLAFELYSRYRDLEEVKKRVVFTTHKPESFKDENHSINLLYKFGFFSTLSLDEVRKITSVENDTFGLTEGAVCVSKITNAISRFHGDVVKHMWQAYPEKSKITYITNAQNRRFWADKGLIDALEQHEDYQLIARKKHNKHVLFDVVADQTGKMFDPEILTIVWARRFAEHKRPGLLKYDFARFRRLLENDERPVQIIWAGKPHPYDTYAINLFNELIHISHDFKRMAVLVGYELDLSLLLKKGSDIWLNTPRICHEASGTSGISASMNASIHFSTNVGWHPEFARHGVNAFTIPMADCDLSYDAQDTEDNKSMMDILEHEIIPLYYEKPENWLAMMKRAMSDVMPSFQSGRMAHEYYTKLYNS